MALLSTTSPPPSRLERLKAAPRKPGEASFFFYDAHFKNDAVKILPGEYFVHNEDMLIMTTLGSCIAACIYDRNAKVGGMNHFMLPDTSCCPTAPVTPAATAPMQWNCSSTR
jgi:chemotaxis protein CheD